MHFTSDNIAGASQPILDAIAQAGKHHHAAYGHDALTKSVEQRFAEIFERQVAVFPVTTGTAANALALAAAVPPWGMALCHAESHIIEDECGAPEFFMHGAKLRGLSGAGGKITEQTLRGFLSQLTPSSVNQTPARALSLSQATEFGTIYTPTEIAALAALAKSSGMAVHMDGARFTNALVALGCTPAEMTWKQGVDILSFGATKNGCLMAEAVVVFDPALAESLAYRRKRAGQTISKNWLIAAQFDAYFADGLWLKNARHANAMAQTLAQQLFALPDIRAAWPTEANEVFAIVPKTLDAKLCRAGAEYYDWPQTSLASPISTDETIIRLVTSFATQEAEIEALLAAVNA